MDGFHLHDDELARLGLAHRKGAPETFDVAGYAALLRQAAHRLRADRLRAGVRPFSRELAVAGAIAVRPEHRLVVTEGNYLLYDAPGWSDVRALLDEVWFVESRRGHPRSSGWCERHAAHGKPRDLAQRWATVSDQANAELVSGTRDDADLVVHASTEAQRRRASRPERGADHRQLQRQPGESDRLEAWLLVFIASTAILMLPG